MTRMSLGRNALITFFVGMLGAGCGSSDSDFASAPSFNGDNSESPAAPGADTPPGEEQEIESFYEAPVATSRFVWIANPTSGRVAYVDASTLQVKTVDAGNAPTYLAGLPGQTDDAAIVLNVLSEDATLLRIVNGAFTSQTFKTAAKTNSWAISKDGKFAIAWGDARKADSAPKTEGFQDLTILDLVKGTSTSLAVGYRPVAISFSATDAKAYAVTQDGIAVIDLTAAAPKVDKNIAISATPTEDPGTRDVSITPDGTLALVRRDGVATISVVSLDTGTRTEVTLSGAVTDLDLTPLGDRAVAVVRSTSEVAILPVPAIAQDPLTFGKVTITGETIGSVSLSSDGSSGLLYTNASAVERLTLLSLSSPGTFRTVRVYAPVLSVHTTPDGAHATVLHATSESESAFSLLPLAAALPARIVATTAPPYAVALANDRVVVAERSDSKKIYGVDIAKLPELTSTHYDLASPPLSAGIVPSVRRAYVAQRHPEGRITFVHLDTGVASTLTGFELGARVVDGSKP